MDLAFWLGSECLLEASSQLGWCSTQICKGHRSYQVTCFDLTIDSFAQQVDHRDRRWSTCFCSFVAIAFIITINHNPGTNDGFLLTNLVVRDELDVI